MEPTPDTQSAAAAADASAETKARFSLTRLIPVAVILAAIGAVFALGLDRYLTFQALQENREILLAFRDANYLSALLIYIAVYAVAVALSLPGGAVLTISGGFLFGGIFGTLFAVLGATMGAVGVFLIARTALGEPLRAQAGPWLKTMETGFREDAFNYMLTLRLIPIFPFFLVNIVPAFLGVSLRTYAIATFFGIIPGGFVFAYVGAGLGSVFDSGAEFDISAVVTPQILIALVGLGLLSLLPVVYKKIKGKPPEQALADAAPPEA